MDRRGEEKGEDRGLRLGDGRVLAVIAVFCLILGGMALDPVLSMCFFVVSVALSTAALIRCIGGLKAVAALILIISAAAVLSALPSAQEHFEAYRGRVSQGQRP